MFKAAQSHFWNSQWKQRIVIRFLRDTNWVKLLFCKTFCSVKTKRSTKTTIFLSITVIVSTEKLNRAKRTLHFNFTSFLSDVWLWTFFFFSPWTQVYIQSYISLTHVLSRLSYSHFAKAFAFQYFFFCLNLSYF